MLRRLLAALVIPTAAFALLAGPVSASPVAVSGATANVNPAGVPTQGIIMRDGGICNPRWGC
ncbi:hypothetical protein DVA67_032815 [Solirubrobacter sp. CPCC 204708]|uniref:Uncharacterized protein n=1 Tax=Solirubrobacter deserti TaxID=2282478 RepID=A0ABT4RIT5_9ACTN|nr:hypothetical protein [Solirubrobacter deserti]MBE2320788.1 hypothetical protein [Solirubrobacter deserti]MDA0138423.1 hypothetical protein [Solirubrobacter deserti]